MVVVAPAPGQGITLADGTLVFPTQDVMRKEPHFPILHIVETQNLDDSNPAYSDMTECNAHKLSDGTVMLNMRDNRNRGNKEVNGRRICTTTDLGETWTEHSTSRKKHWWNRRVWQVCTVMIILWVEKREAYYYLPIPAIMRHGIS